MDYYRVIEMKNSDCAATLKDFIDKDRTNDFLAGLNVEYDQVRVQILGKDDLPSLNEVISIIIAEESRRGVMLDPKPVEASAMVAKGRGNRGFKNDQLPAKNGKTNITFMGNDNHENMWYTF